MKTVFSYGLSGIMLLALLVTPFAFAQLIPSMELDDSQHTDPVLTNIAYRTPAIESVPYDWAKRYPLIAHALGGIGGYPGTNSFESLIRAYRSGFRVFETDIVVTSDGHLVLRHDWVAGSYPVLGQKAPKSQELGPMTLSKFKATKIQHRYTPVSFKELVRFMSSHPDVQLITDTKEPDSFTAASIFKLIVKETSEVDPQVLRRIIPQLYEEDNFEAVSGVYPFKQYIYTLYMNNDSMDEVVDFASRNGIGVVVMDENKYSPAFVDALRKKGIYTYINTINDVGQIRRYMNAGVRGVMTDFVVPADLRRA
jgi:glycerophosphoryl diester phosphodiesterase